MRRTPLSPRTSSHADDFLRRGYLGVAVVLAFLKAGHRVRGTTRTQAQADAFLAAYPAHAANIEFVVVPSIVVPHAFEEAVRGVDLIAHTASPVPRGEIVVRATPPSRRHLLTID